MSELDRVAGSTLWLCVLLRVVNYNDNMICSAPTRVFGAENRAATEGGAKRRVRFD